MVILKKTFYYDTLYLVIVVKKCKKAIVINKNKFFYFLLLWIVVFASCLVKKTFQNDTFYSIKIGELIIHNGIDMLDHFSFHNLGYTYPHWLFDVFVYLFYKIGGYNGIYIFTILLNILLLYTIFKCTYKLTDVFSSSFIVTIVCAIIMGQGFATARAHLVSYILFVLELYSIEMFNKERNKKYVIILLLISFLLCNIHVAVWPFYFIIFIPYLVEGIISFILKKIKKKDKIINFLESKLVISNSISIKCLLLIMLLSLLMGLFTPIKGTPYTYLYKTMIGNSQNYILEHQMSTLKDSVFTLTIVIEVLLVGAFSKIKLSDLLLLIGLSLMSIMSIRHIGLLAILVSICLARTYKYFIDAINIDVDKYMYKFFSKKGILILSFIAVGIFFYVNLSSQLKNSYIDEKIYPVEGVKYIKNNLDYKNVRIFNDYNFGSYLLLNDIPVFIDSRADLYTKEFSGLDYDIFDDYMHVSNNYEKLFDFYNISHVFIYNNIVLSGYLINDDNYKIVYNDKNFILFERLSYYEKE